MTAAGTWKLAGEKLELSPQGEGRQILRVESVERFSGDVAKVRIVPSASVIRHEAVKRYLDVVSNVEGQLKPGFTSRTWMPSRAHSARIASSFVEARRR
jgi:phage-related protein